MKLYDNFSSLPNILSFIRIALTPVFVYLFWQEGVLFVVSIIFFTVAALTDWLDGHFARKHQQTTDWGGFLDPLADKILVWSALVCCALKGIMPWLVVGVIVVRDTVVTVLRMIARKRNKTLHTLFAAKCKTVAQFIMLYCTFFLLLIITHDFPYVGWAVFVGFITLFVAVLTAYTGVEYVYQFYRLKK